MPEAETIERRRRRKGEAVTKKRWLSAVAMTSVVASDTQCGFKGFTREAAKRIFALQKIEDWGFDPEILLIGRLLDYRIKEIPVETFHREGSKINPVLDSIKMFMELLSIRRNVFAQIGHLRPGAVPTVMPVPQKATTNQVEAA